QGISESTRLTRTRSSMSASSGCLLLDDFLFLQGVISQKVSVSEESSSFGSGLISSPKLQVKLSTSMGDSEVIFEYGVERGPHLFIRVQPIATQGLCAHAPCDTIRFKWI